MKLSIVLLLGCFAMTCLAYPTVQNGTGGIWESVTDEQSSGENLNHKIFKPIEENREQGSAKMIKLIRYTTTKEPSIEDTQQGIQQPEVKRHRQSAQVNPGQDQPLESTSEQPTTQTAQPPRQQRSAQMNPDQGQPLVSTSEQPTTQTAQPVQQQSEGTRQKRSAQVNPDRGQLLESTSEQPTTQTAQPVQQQSE